MIGYIRGTLLEIFKSGKTSSSVVIWTGEKDALGLGYTVIVSDTYALALLPQQRISLWTYAVHSENDSYLLGFSSVKKMKYFLSLLSVQGVGPKTAMQIVEILGEEGISTALAGNDVSLLSKVPGVGKKTAAKILLELSGKDLDLSKVLDTKSTTEDLTSFADVIATLQKLGYSSAAARDAVAKSKDTLNSRKSLSTAEKVKLVLASSSL